MVKGFFVALTLSVGAATWFSGCSPDLKEGVYGCATAEQCPSGWYCHENDRCYSTPPTGADETGMGGNGASSSGGAASGGANASGGAATGGSPSSGGQTGDGETFAACEADTECASGECILSLDTTVDSGVCTVACVNDADCNEDTLGADGVCTGGQCILACDSPTDCTPPQTCWEITDMNGPGRFGCYENSSSGTMGALRCGPSIGACPLPTSCQLSSMNPMDGGMCGQECVVGDTCTLPNNTCIQLFTTKAVCMMQCTDTTECTDDAECVSLGTEGTFCAPASWADEDLPMVEFGPPM